MKNIGRRIITLSATSIVCGALLVSCGAGSDDTASPSSLPLVETTTSVADSTATPVDTAPDSAPDTSTSSTPELTVEMFENMLETESGRTLLASSMAGEMGIELEASQCLIDSIPLELLVEAASAFLGGETDGALFSAEQAAQMTPLFDMCGIAPESLMP